MFVFAPPFLTYFSICIFFFLSLPPPPPSKEIGGLYFSANVLLSQAGCWVAAALYSSYYIGTTTTRTNDDGTKTVYSNKIPDSAIFSVLGALLATWLLSAFFFFFNIKRAYWGTFYSTTTGCQQAMSHFLEHDDARKSLIFRKHTDLWKKIERDVKEWTFANWSNWEVEKPAWFTDAFKESVPDDFIPGMSLEALKKEGGGERRRSIAFAGMAAPTRQEGENGAGASGK